MIQTWRLDCSRQTLVLAARDSRLAEVVYWARRLPDGEDLETLAEAVRLDVTGGMLDENPALSICPEANRSFPGYPGLSLRYVTGDVLLPAFRLTNVQETSTSLFLTYKDGDLTYEATFGVDLDTHMITASASLVSAAPVILDWLSTPVFPAPQLSDETIEFSGRWIGEFQTRRTPWSAGARLRENRTGRTGHEHFPALIVPTRGATNTNGEAIAFHYGWSGGHRMVAEELPDGRRQIQFGHAGATETRPATRFETATLYATWSDAGLNGCATAFQRHLRDKVVTWPNPARPRPVHYNCWEAVYFDHDVAELKEIATKAAHLGAERFVLDDGWFGHRDDDKTSLGDWSIDPRKYPEGLAPLIEHVKSEGMTFGLWLEPEMVNPDSELFRTHPDWALGPDDQIAGRHQRVLDMGNPAVRNHLFERIHAILSHHDIDYIKWDHNRVLPTPDAKQTRGTYALLDRVRAEHPAVEIESCASGGGRIDFGMLRRTQRVWLSDSNDALERLRIQHEAALFLPLAVTGSHVGPRTCHTSGRTLDIRFRAWVAAQRQMGFEMDPRELSAEEETVLIRVTAWWKENRGWLQRADILRLDSRDPSVIAEMQIAENGSRFVLFAGQAAASSQITPRPLRLNGLEPDASYRIELLNREESPRLSRGNPVLKIGSMTVSGTWLMQHGVILPWSEPERMWVVEGHRV